MQCCFFLVYKLHLERFLVNPLWLQWAPICSMFKNELIIKPVSCQHFPLLLFLHSFLAVTVMHNPQSIWEQCAVVYPLSLENPSAISHLIFISKCGHTRYSVLSCAGTTSTIIRGSKIKVRPVSSIPLLNSCGHR